MSRVWSGRHLNDDVHERCCLCHLPMKTCSLWIVGRNSAKGNFLRLGYAAQNVNRQYRRTSITKFLTERKLQNGILSGKLKYLGSRRENLQIALVHPVLGPAASRNIRVRICNKSIYEHFILKSVKISPNQLQPFRWKTLMQARSGVLSRLR